MDIYNYVNMSKYVHVSELDARPGGTQACVACAPCSGAKLIYACQVGGKLTKAGTRLEPRRCQVHVKLIPGSSLFIACMYRGYRAVIFEARL